MIWPGKPSRRRTLFALMACSCGVMPAQSPEHLIRRENLERERVRIERFEHRQETSALAIGAMATGRTVMDAARSAYVRRHLVVEVLVIPSHSDGIDLNNAAFRLRVNGEKMPRLPQTPELVAHYVRTEGDALQPKLNVGVGVGNADATWESGPGRRSRFPGDPRAPRSPIPRGEDETETKVPLDAEAELVVGTAFRGGAIFEATAGFLYFPCDLDLRKVKRLELLVYAEGESATPIRFRLR